MTSFYRLSGGGNDFLALVEPDSDPEPQQIRAWCTRGLSLGADGLFVLRRTREGARMSYFNADGSAASLCLNGTRCAALLALELGWAGRHLVITTGAGTVEAWPDGPHAIRTRLARPALPAEESTVELEGDSHRGWRIDVGVPHFVVSWEESLALAPVATLGAALRRHPGFGPHGTNVDFARFCDPHRLEIRSFERGVEAETLACGTGVLAAVQVGLQLQRSALPVAALTRGGFELAVTESPGDSRWWDLRGDARIVAEGRLRPAAEHLPEPPAWR